MRQAMLIIETEDAPRFRIAAGDHPILSRLKESSTTCATDWPTALDQENGESRSLIVIPAQAEPIPGVQNEPVAEPPAQWCVR